MRFSIEVAMQEWQWHVQWLLYLPHAHLDITKANSQPTDVKMDATNGKVLGDREWIKLWMKILLLKRVPSRESVKRKYWFITATKWNLKLFHYPHHFFKLYTNYRERSLISTPQAGTTFSYSRLWIVLTRLIKYNSHNQYHVILAKIHRWAHLYPISLYVGWNISKYTNLPH